MHRNPSVMKHAFSQVPKADIPRSTFDRSHGYKTTFNAGYLVPVFMDEALPGDTFNVRGTLFGRLNTPIFPIMDNMVLDTFFFSVPIRLLWNNWQRFNGEQENPDDSTDFVVPTITAPTGGYASQSLSDYMGLPTGIAGFKHSAFWHRAYNLIWNQWFRDQNLQDSVTVKKDDGPDDPALYTLLRRGKRHDYFTSSLPWPQKGPGVTIPLGGTAPIHGLIRGGGAVDGSVISTYVDQDNQPVQAGVGYFRAADAVPSQAVGFRAKSGNAEMDVYADLSEATAATINSLRQAFQIQKIYERDARGGTRYTELIKAHFGVTSPDARLQRPEFLGGGSTPVNISPIPQTSGTPGTGGYTPTPQGNLAAVGTVTAHGHGFTHSFTEHCVVIGLACVRADLTYQQGLDRMWSRSTRFDFYWPALAHIGEQAVKMQEIYCTGTATDEEVWGYQERFAEYRYKPSRITGKLRSSDPQTLDAWHLSQYFVSQPLLTDIFIQENPPIDRVVAVPSEPHFILDAFFKFKAARPMPVYGVPGLIDHF